MAPARTTHKCGGCDAQIPPWATACKRCWWRIPGWLQTALRDEQHQCKLAGIAHSQELLRLKAQALEHLKPKHKEAAE